MEADDQTPRRVTTPPPASGIATAGVAAASPPRLRIVPWLQVTSFIREDAGPFARLILEGELFTRSRPPRKVELVVDRGSQAMSYRAVTVHTERRSVIGGRGRSGLRVRLAFAVPPALAIDRSTEFRLLARRRGAVELPFPSPVPWPEPSAPRFSIGAVASAAALGVGTFLATPAGALAAGPAPAALQAAACSPAPGPGDGGQLGGAAGGGTAAAKATTPSSQSQTADLSGSTTSTSTTITLAATPTTTAPGTPTKLPVDTSSTATTTTTGTGTTGTTGTTGASCSTASSTSPPGSSTGSTGTAGSGATTGPAGDGGPGGGGGSTGGGGSAGASGHGGSSGQGDGGISGKSGGQGGQGGGQGSKRPTGSKSTTGTVKRTVAKAISKGLASGSGALKLTDRVHQTPAVNQPDGNAPPPVVLEPTVPTPTVSITPIGAGFGLTDLWGGSSSLANPFTQLQLDRFAAQAQTITRPPKYLVKIYEQAARRYHVPWEVLAAINYIETGYGRDLAVSSAGAVGWMQFMPSTWAQYGEAVNVHGLVMRNRLANPWIPRDAIFSAARLLVADGAHRSLARAVYGYNHALWYVQEVLTLAERITARRLRHHAKPKQRLHAMQTMAKLLNGIGYVWGGGHTTSDWIVQAGYDCSGFVSAVLHTGGYLRFPQTTQTLPSQQGIAQGPGRWVTIFDRTNAGINDDHVIIDLNGYFWEEGGGGPSGASMVHLIRHVSGSYLRSFNVVLHPRGL